MRVEGESSAACATSVKPLERAKPDRDHLGGESRIPGKREADVPRKREHPLPHGGAWKNLVDELGRAIRDASARARGADRAPRARSASSIPWRRNARSSSRRSVANRPMRVLLACAVEHAIQVLPDGEVEYPTTLRPGARTQRGAERRPRANGASQRTSARGTPLLAIELEAMCLPPTNHVRMALRRCAAPGHPRLDVFRHSPGPVAPSASRGTGAAHDQRWMPLVPIPALS